METGPRNLITDVPGLSVGNADDGRLISGVTVLVADRPMVASADVRGGAPGTRDTQLLSPEMTVQAIDAVALSGGSAFGLDAGGGVQARLREAGRGFAVGDVRVPIVPTAILFDLGNGGDKDWGRFPPYRDLAYNACRGASADFALGSAGAGFGATAGDLRGGLGSASCVTTSGVTIGALAAVNALGRVTIGEGPHFWAGGWEIGEEFGGLGWPSRPDEAALAPYSKGATPSATVLAVVATDAALTKTEAKRLAVMAQDGLARAIHPVHTPFDGDVVFVLSTGDIALADPPRGMVELGAAAARTLARAVARGVYEAGRNGQGAPALPAWRDRFGDGR